MLHQLKPFDRTVLPGLQGGVQLYNRPIPLPALHSVAVPALCMAVIPHGLELISVPDDREDSLVMLVKGTNILTTRGLLIEQGPLCDGIVTTVVFNMTNQELRIRKGEVVSHLIRVIGCSWVGV